MRKMKTLNKMMIRAGLAAMALGVVGSAQAQIVTPVNMSVSGSVRVDANAAGSAFGSAAYSDVLGSLGVRFIPNNPVEIFNPYGRAPEYMQAQTFFVSSQSDASGTFRFQHAGEVNCSSQECYDGIDPLLGGSLNYADRWSYSFTANQNANFRFNYNLQVPSTIAQYAGEFRNPFMIMSIRERGNIGGPGATGGSGFFDFSLLANQDYTFDLEVFSVRSLGEGELIPYRIGDDLYSYQITPTIAGIPEPATWAMMIAGFGLVGAGMRRRVVKVSYA
jgi:PEP-CTERM motif